MNQELSPPGVAIVTGAARGIGASIAIRLAAAGHAVAVLDLDEQACAETVAKITATGQRALAVDADVADEASVAQAIKRIVGQLGAPTVLVNNAGILRENILHKMSLADWELVMSVNLRGAFLMSRAVSPYMRAAKWGRIVNLSSTAALGYVGGASYSAAKAGLLGFTKTLALELGRYNITVNAVAPGFIVTEMTRATAERVGVSFAELESNALRDIAVGRTGNPDDIAHAIGFFVDEKSGFVSGQVLYVAGGPKG